MRIIDWLSKSVALALPLTFVLATTPASAAELASSNPVLGALSGAGSVQVRGVALQEETTLFSGDRIRTGPGAYVKISLADGARVEAAGNSDFAVKREGDKGIRLNITAGSVAFTASKNPLIVTMNGHEVHPQAGSRGQVAMLAAADMADVRVFSGNVEVRNLATKGTVALAKGAERVLNLKTGAIESPTIQIASVAPSVPPAGMPAAAPPPPPLTKSAVALAGTLGGAAVAIVYVATMDAERTSSIAASNAQASASAEVTSLVAAAAAAVSAGAEINSLANLIGSSYPEDADEANAIRAAANVTVAQILTLNGQLLALSNQINGLNPGTQQELLFALTQEIIVRRATLNSLIDSLNMEIQQINELARLHGMSNFIRLREHASPFASNFVP